MSLKEAVVVVVDDDDVVVSHYISIHIHVHIMYEGHKAHFNGQLKLNSTF